MTRLAILLFVLFLSFPALAMEDDDGMAGGIVDGNALVMEPQNEGEMQKPVTIEKPEMHRVTSLQKCLDQLDPEDAAEVKLNAIRPYQECQSRLAAKAAEKREIKVSRKKKKAEEAEQEAESPRNFSRVDEKGSVGTDEKDAQTTGHWVSAKALKEAGEDVEGTPREPKLPAIEEDEADEKPKKSGRFSKYLPDIKPDNSKARYNN